MTMDRLLTEGEIDTIAFDDGLCFAKHYTDLSRKILEAQRDLTRKETLKAVGEWIKSHDGLVLNKYIETLLRGEMPE